MCSRIAILFFVLVGSVCSYSLDAQNASIAGIVVDADNLPLRGDISVYRLEIKQGNVAAEPLCFRSTNLEGQFQCDRLVAGRYLIVVDLQSNTVHTSLRASDSSDWGIPLFAFYPKEFDGNLEDLLKLNSGDFQNISIMVTSEPLSTLEVQPLGNGNYPYGQIRLYLNVREITIPLLVRRGTDESNGTQLLRNVPLGTYSIAELSTSDSEMHEFRDTLVFSSSFPAALSLPEIKYSRVWGSISRDEHQGPISSLSLNPDGRQSGKRYTASVGNDGQFAFENVEKGRYIISIDSPSEQYIAEIWKDGRVVGDGITRVNVEIDQSPLTLIAKGTDSSVSGTVDLDTCGAVSKVLLHSVDRNTNEIFDVNSLGRFSTVGLAPGQYVLSAWQDIAMVPYENSAALAMDKKESLDIELGEHSHKYGIELPCNHSPK